MLGQSLSRHPSPPDYFECLSMSALSPTIHSLQFQGSPRSPDSSRSLSGSGCPTPGMDSGVGNDDCGNWTGGWMCYESKMSRGRKAETQTLGRSTTSLTLKSTATLQMT